MSDARIQAWERQLAEAEDDNVKNILRMQIDTYKMGLQEGRVSSVTSSSSSGRGRARYDPLIGKKSAGGIRLALFVLHQTRVKRDPNVIRRECETFTSPADAGINLRAVRILPFWDVEATETIKKEDNGYTLIFDVNGNPFRWTTLTYVELGLYGSHTYRTNSWHIADGVRIERRESNGTVYTNVRATSLTLWEEGPTRVQMYDLCQRFYSNEQYALRPLPMEVFPTREAVLEGLVKGTDGKYDYKKIEERCCILTDERIREHIEANNLPSSAYGHYRRYGTEYLFIPFSDPGVRDFARLPTTPGATIDTSGTVGWAEKMSAAKSEQALKRANSSPFEEQFSAPAQSEVSLMTIKDGEIDVRAFLIKTLMFSPLSTALGITNPFFAKKIAPEILPKVHIALTGGVSVPEAWTMDINTTVPSYTDTLPKTRKYGIPVSVFQPPYIPIVTMVRSVGVQITADYAISLVNKHIKFFKGKVADESACKLSALAKSSNTINAQRYEWCEKTNELPTWTNKRVYNLFESPLHIKKSNARDWRFYSVSNAVFTAITEQHVRDVIAFHELPQESAYTASHFEEMAKLFDTALQQLSEGNESVYFSAPQVGDGEFCQVVFAVHRDIDHTDIEVFDHPTFNVKKPTVAVTSSSAASSSSDAPVQAKTRAYDDAFDDDHAVADISDSVDDFEVQKSTRGRSGRPQQKNVKKTRSD
mgnify:CR=1 FL=1